MNKVKKNCILEPKKKYCKRIFYKQGNKKGSYKLIGDSEDELKTKIDLVLKINSNKKFIN